MLTNHDLKERSSSSPSYFSLERPCRSTKYLRALIFQVCGDVLGIEDKLSREFCYILFVVIYPIRKHSILGIDVQKKITELD
jgi:hypothetical protein